VCTATGSKSSQASLRRIKKAVESLWKIVEGCAVCSEYPFPAEEEDEKRMKEVEELQRKNCVLIGYYGWQVNNMLQRQVQTTLINHSTLKMESSTGYVMFLMLLPRWFSQDLDGKGTHTASRDLASATNLNHAMTTFYTFPRILPKCSCKLKSNTTIKRVPT
jgi:hypothetical protein